MGCTNDYDNPIVYFFSVIAHLTFTSGCNSVWQECNIWDVDAAGSSPVIPTIYGGIPKRFKGLAY